MTFFGIACRNLSKKFIFGLAERHWPGRKRADEVASMLHHTIHYYEGGNLNFRHAKNLVLNANNCGEQNKNRFLIFYFTWRLFVGLED